MIVEEALKEIRRGMEHARLSYDPQAWNVVHDELQRLANCCQAKQKIIDNLRIDIELLKHGARVNELSLGAELQRYREKFGPLGGTEHV